MKRLWLLILWCCATGIISPSQAAIRSEVLSVIENGVDVNLKDQLREVAQVPATEQVLTSTYVQQPIVDVVSFGDRNTLIQALAQIATDGERNFKRNHYIALSFVVIAIIFGVMAAVAAFCNLRIVAGVFSILTVAVVTANIALPFRDDAGAYKTVAALSKAVWREAILDASMKKEEYIEYRRKLEALAIYSDEKVFPETQSLIENLFEQ